MPRHKKVFATLAFIFNDQLDQVLLIEKVRPIFHAGLLNGLGGKTEGTETPLACVVREVWEEAGIEFSPDDFLPVGSMTWAEWDVSIWTAQCHGEMPRSFSDPNVSWYAVESLPANTIDNLRWLIPLSLDVVRQKAKGQAYPFTRVEY